MNILELHHLRKYFATQKAVEDISFSIEQGSIFGLLGPNGAGKTTLLRMITGIFYPDSGNILFNGQPFNISRDNRQIGYMPEERGLYRKMKVGEHALYLAQLKGLSKQAAMQKVKAWFEKFEMQAWWNKRIEDLSKGMSQKLQFVTTVLHEPSLIILDEPFSGLDPVNAHLIKEAIVALVKNGSTVIFSTHRMEQVEEICDRIVLINKGEKILDATVKEAKQQFKEHIYQIGVQAQPEHLMIHLFKILQYQPDKLLVQFFEGTQNNEVLQYFIHRGLPIHSFNEILPSLNEIFIKLVGSIPEARQFESI